MVALDSYSTSTATPTAALEAAAQSIARGAASLPHSAHASPPRAAQGREHLPIVRCTHEPAPLPYWMPPEGPDRRPELPDDLRAPLAALRVKP